MTQKCRWCQSVRLAGANAHRLRKFAGANLMPPKIRGCHGTRGTHADAPSDYHYSLWSNTEIAFEKTFQRHLSFQVIYAVCVSFVCAL